MNDKAPLDTSLRAAITDIRKRVMSDIPALGIGEALDNLEESVQDLVTTALATQRTAIKAALPEKRKYTQYGSLGFSVDADNRTKGYNQALTDVTQVIDGREGV